MIMVYCLAVVLCGCLSVDRYQILCHQRVHSLPLPTPLGAGGSDTSEAEYGQLQCSNLAPAAAATQDLPRLWV